jgi:hypothetical protein
MELLVRAAVIAWLASDPTLGPQINSITEQVPSPASLPWLAIAASASADWSSKSFAGREVRVALELHWRDDQSDTAAELVAAIEQRIAALPPAQPGYDIVAIQFIRARTELQPANIRVIVLEYRFRLIAH